jgi:hypothetical protein
MKIFDHPWILFSSSNELCFVKKMSKIKTSTYTSVNIRDGQRLAILDLSSRWTAINTLIWRFKD